MNKDNKIITSSEVPIFAAATGATSYKFGTEGFIDLIFMRPTFVLGDTVENPDASPGNESRSTEMQLQTVGAVTLTETQAKQLILAVQDQLDRLKEI